MKVKLVSASEMNSESETNGFYFVVLLVDGWDSDGAELAHVLGVLRHHHLATRVTIHHADNTKQFI